MTSKEYLDFRETAIKGSPEAIGIPQPHRSLKQVIRSKMTFSNFLRLSVAALLFFPLRSLSFSILRDEKEVSKRESSAVTSFIASESPIALNGVLANIGPSGALSSGASSGIVIAAPSTVNPDYLYTWTRDSALTIKQLVEAYILGNTSLATTINNYMAAQEIVQQIDNPSGSFTTGGLGEPKFNIDETAFTGSWGRPQRDGPALRSIAMIMWANEIYSSDESYVTETLWPMIQADLNYIATYWNGTGFDLWEEIDGSSFWTISNQYRAMTQGYTLSSKLGSTNSTYSSTATALLCFAQNFWDSDASSIIANINVDDGRSGIDANSVLTSIMMFDKSADCNSLTFQPCSDRALANHKTYVDSFRSIYSINDGIASNAGVATGRYPEDVYYNGNPWYLATLACAEQLYDALYTWNELGSLEVTSTSLAFFQQFDSSVTAGTYASSTSTYTTLIDAIGNYADEFVTIIQDYLPTNGSISEQFDKSTGAPLSAYDLTWSFTAFLTMAHARASNMPPSWGSTDDTAVSGCPAYVLVTFNEYATTVYGENIYISGSIPALGNWDTSLAVALNADNYPTWQTQVYLPGSTYIEYKFIRIESDGTVEWQDGDNSELTTPASGTYTVDSTWE